MAYAIENFEHGYLRSSFVYVDNIEFAKVFSTIQLACEYIAFLGLDGSNHRVVFDADLEPDEFESEYFEEEIEVPYPRKKYI